MSTNTTSEFRIYVASLADYNDGRLHGEWFALEDYSDVDDLQEAVNAMLARSPFGNSDFAKEHGLTAEEYAIHDYEGFPQGTVSEYYSLSSVWELWEHYEQAEKDGNLEAFIAYEQIFDGDYNDFEDRYKGAYDSEEDFAESYLEDSGLLGEIPENLKCYFDYAAYARDLFCGGFTMQDGYVFWNC